MYYDGTVNFAGGKKYQPVDGFAIGGRSYVNKSNLEQSLHFTVFHETYHIAEQRAAAGDSTPARRRRTTPW